MSFSIPYFTPEQLVRIQNIDKEYQNLMERNPFADIEISSLLEAVFAFTATLPDEVTVPVFANHRASIGVTDEDDDLAFESEYEDLALICAYLYDSALSLPYPKSFRLFLIYLASFDEHLRNLRSECHTYDTELGGWR